LLKKLTCPPTTHLAPCKKEAVAEYLTYYLHLDLPPAGKHAKFGNSYFVTESQMSDGQVNLFTNRKKKFQKIALISGY
jgi:hypothetical protein